MSSLLRKYQQPLMIVLTILVIFLFVGYWNGPTGMRNNRMPHTSDDYARMYGNTITLTAAQREAHKGQLALALGLDLFRDLVGRPASMNEALDNFVWNSF